MLKGLKPRIASQLRESSRTLEASARLAPDIAQAVELLLRAYRKGGKALIFGNGGSAADAQHFAAELVGRFERDRPAMPALALTANTSDLTAIGNDMGFDELFARQIEAHARPGDVAVAISTSGSSPNVLAGAAVARRLKLPVVALTGPSGGQLKDLADVCIRIPSASVPRVQEAHGAIIHIWCGIIEEDLFPDSRRAH
jgi:D-sedoheptulose 7-phosphate isomerase